MKRALSASADHSLESVPKVPIKEIDKEKVGGVSQIGELIARKYRHGRRQGNRADRQHIHKVDDDHDLMQHRHQAYDYDHPGEVVFGPGHILHAQSHHRRGRAPRTQRLLFGYIFLKQIHGIQVQSDVKEAN